MNNSNAKGLHTYFLGMVMLTMLLSSCRKDFSPVFEGEEYKVVVNALVNNKDTLYATITKSLKINEPFKVNELTDAKVWLFENDRLMDQLRYSKQPNEEIGKFKSNFVPVIGKQYRIEVEANNLKKVLANAIVPNGADIINPGVKFLGGNSFNVNFDFEDSAEVGFYYIKMFFRTYTENPSTGEKTFVGEQIIQLPETALPDVQQYVDNGYIFTDASFNGSTVNFAGIAKSSSNPPEFIGADVFPDNSRLFIRLETLSEDAYKFYSSHSVALNTSIDFFSEGSSVYGNVENGLGIFAGIYVSELGVEVE